MTDNSEIPMFFEAPSDIFAKAKLLRKKMTPEEFKLWNFLKGKNVLGLRFRAQHPIGLFIADFYCHQIGLIIEIDGKIHDSELQRTSDQERSEVLQKWSIEIIRFTNFQVKNRFEFVQNEIIKTVQTRLNHLKTHTPDILPDFDNNYTPFG
jgi:very-short-patch-repair endonuclease